MKKCTKCNIVKSYSLFSKNKNTKDGFCANCKECMADYKKSYYKKNKKRLNDLSKNYRVENKEKLRNYFKKHSQDNKEKIKERRKQHYEKNKEVLLQKNKLYVKNNKEGTRKRKREWKRKKLANDPSYKLRENVSHTITIYLKTNKKQGSSWDYLPYTPQQLKEHLEFLWEPWMNWGNYGPYYKDKRTWNLDHIIPQSLLLYNSMDHPNFQKCWSLSNLRPLDAKENSKKRNKLLK